MNKWLVTVSLALVAQFAQSSCRVQFLSTGADMDGSVSWVNLIVRNGSVPKSYDTNVGTLKVGDSLEVDRDSEVALAVVPNSGYAYGKYTVRVLDFLGNEVQSSRDYNSGQSIQLNDNQVLYVDRVKATKTATTDMQWRVPVYCESIPEHVTLRFDGADAAGAFTATVAGPVGFTNLMETALNTYGWNITATADTGFETPTFKVCPYYKAQAYKDQAIECLGTASVQYETMDAVYIYDIHTEGTPIPEKHWTVTFDGNDGKVVEDSRMVGDGVRLGTMPTATRDGYKLLGWITEKKQPQNELPSSGVTQFTALTVITNDVSLWACWRKSRYEVRLNLNGGTLADGADVTSYDTDKVTPLPSASAMSREGYIFDGWSDTNGGTNRFTVISADKRENLFFWAQWIPEVFSVRLHRNRDAADTDCKTVNNLECSGGSMLPEVPFTLNGRVFTAWNTQADGAGESYGDGELIDLAAPGVVDLYAQWSNVTYKVNFDVNGGSGSMDPQAFTQDQAQTLANGGFTRDGYGFRGWNTKADGTGDAYADGALVNNLIESGAEITLYAQWQANEVTFHAPEGGVVTNGLANYTKMYTPGETWGELPEATNLVSEAGQETGAWAFNGWRWEQQGFWSPVDATDTVRAGITNLVAQWSYQAPELSRILDAPEQDFTLPPTDTINMINVNAEWEKCDDDFTQGGSSMRATVESISGSGQSVLKTTVIGTGRLSFAVKSLISSNSAEAYKGSVTLDREEAAEGFEFRKVNADGSLGEQVFGLCDSGSKWIAWTNDTDDATWQPGHLGWTNFTYEITADDPNLVPTNTFAWAHVFHVVAQTISGTSWVDHVVWEPAATERPSWLLTFDANDGTGTMPDDFTVFGDATTNLPACAFTRAGYAFQGWALTEDGEVVFEDEADRVGLTTNATLYAVWERMSCLVTFDAGDGDVGTLRQEVHPGEAYGTLPVPTRVAGYEFVGWFTAAEGGTQVTATTEVTATADHTLYAQWQIAGCTVTFGGAGTESLPSASMSVDCFAAYGELPTPSRDGYDFEGWFTAAKGGTQVTATTICEATADHTLYAQWTAKVYTVVFDANGGEGTLPASFPLPYGEGAALPVNELVRDGFDAQGWNTKADGTGSAYADLAQLRNPEASTFTLYAAWTAHAYLDGEKMPVAISVNGVETSVQAIVGEPWGAALPSAPTAPEGYEFVGWYTEPNGQGTLVTADTLVSAGVRGLYASFQALPPPTEVDYRLYETVTPAVLEVGGVYDGRLLDAEGRLVGVVQVKLAKYNAKKDLAKVTATVQIAGEKKLSLKGGELRSASTEVTMTAKDGRQLKVVLGTRGLSGTFAGYLIDGALNVFTCKDAAAKSEATQLNAVFKGKVYTLAYPEASGWNGLSVSVGAKGKAKVTGVLADGTKVSYSTQLLVGESRCCVPVAWAKKSAKALVELWTKKDGSNPEVPAVESAVAGLVGGKLADGSVFMLDTAAFSQLLVGEVQQTYLPNGVAVAQQDKKLVVANGAKAGKVAFVKGSTTEIDETKAGANPAALKLSLTIKSGIVKGSFKGYANVNGKLKSTTVTVNGVLVNGEILGSAVVKKSGSVPVVIAP